jgi:hypothetical protein
LAIKFCNHDSSITGLNPELQEFCNIQINIGELEQQPVINTGCWVHGDFMTENITSMTNKNIILAGTDIAQLLISR